MFFDLGLALEALPELPPPTADAVGRLLPGGVTVLVPNPAGRFPLACADDPATLGLRVPSLEGPLAPLGAVGWPVLQSSANRAGEPPPRRLRDVPDPIRQGADLLLDAGELPGTASTVVDLRAYGRDGEWSIVREGAVGADRLAQALSSPSR
jgi:L-threonylcarbamoyladenylate synthase